MKRLLFLAEECPGPVLFAFDFPFGYPAGSDLGGGRSAGKKISQHMTLGQKDANNRFDVGNLLNKTLSKSPGPFWGHPKSHTYKHLTWHKPAFEHSGFAEWRLAEKLLRARRHRIMNVWQLLGQGSVGSQTLTGLAELYQFSQMPSIADRTAYWPFETEWHKKLEGVILAEVWPSLSDFRNINHPIKDAQQVTACLNWLSEKNKAGNLISLFAPPQCLSADEQERCRVEEGWILGVQ